jgi:hypothetical protein
MKRFILKTLLLILPIVILAVVMEYSLRRIPNDYVYKKNYLDQHAGEIQVLLLGASHAYFGLNPVYFSQNTFNASHISQSLDLDFAIFNKYQSNLDSLKIIVLPMSYVTLWSNLANSEEDWRLKNYTLYYGIEGKSLKNYSELLSNKFSINLSRLYEYYFQNKTEITSSELGWGTTFKSENAVDLQESGKIAAKRHTNNDIFSEETIKIFEENLKILNSFSVFCNQRNIKLIFLATPTYYTFRENLNAEQLNKTVETMNNFVKNHSNTYYFNWMDDPDFVAKDFYDADHLNEIGAEKLSKKLAQEIDSLETLNSR